MFTQKILTILYYAVSENIVFYGERWEHFLNYSVRRIIKDKDNEYDRLSRGRMDG